jgi:hypothetical protein
VLVAHVARLLARLGKGCVFATTKPSQREQIELLVDVEDLKCRLELLPDGIVGLLLLEHIYLAVVSGVGARIRVGGFDLLIEFPSLDDDVERLFGRDGQLV